MEDYYVIGLRDERKTEIRYKKYEISDLLDKVDAILTNYGFVSGELKQENDNGDMKHTYEGIEGKVIVRSVDSYGKLISFEVDDKEIFLCPIYVEQKGIPEKIASEMSKDLGKI